MKTFAVHHIDAFGDIPNKGNPAGVVTDADGLDDDTMQAIAKAVGFNETVFVRSSALAEYCYRYFTPGHEMSLCGHATVAATSLLGREGGGSRTFMIETRAGVLPVSYDADAGLVTMRQAAPQFKPFAGDRHALADVLGMDAGHFAPGLPVVYGNTGIWTLLVPVDSVETMNSMRADNARFPGVLQELPRASIHPFVVADGANGCDFVARHFSSPFSGTVEDPVTGTASGVMGAYAMQHLFPNAEEKRFVVAQGESVGRDGRVFVHVVRRGHDMEVSIAGRSAAVGMLSIEA